MHGRLETRDLPRAYSLLTMLRSGFTLSILLGSGLLAGALACARGDAQTSQPPSKPRADAIMKTDDEWKKILSAEEFHILREKGTERAFTGALYKEKREGKYLCRACGLELFSSQTKYESGSGWPSFYKPAKEGDVAEHRDTTLGMVRTEVTCARCGGHLGHVFEDGPQPTGLRYCINSASLKFEPKE